jgi:hypothetical protein
VSVRARRDLLYQRHVCGPCEVTASPTRRLEAGKDVQERRLARAVAPDETNAVARLRFGADLLEDVDGAERDGDVFECNDAYGGCSLERVVHYEHTGMGASRHTACVPDFPLFVFPRRWK